MARNLATPSEEQEIFDTVQQMKQLGVRRLPVVDRQRLPSELTKAVACERKHEVCARP